MRRASTCMVATIIIPGRGVRAQLSSRLMPTAHAATRVCAEGQPASWLKPCSYRQVPLQPEVSRNAVYGFCVVGDHDPQGDALDGAPQRRSLIFLAPYVQALKRRISNWTCRRTGLAG